MAGGRRARRRPCRRCGTRVLGRRGAQTPDIAGHQLPTWLDVVERDYRAWDGERLVIDTSREAVQETLRRILSAVGP